VRDIINKNGVRISDKTIAGGHKEIENACCECGDKLIVAPAALQDAERLVVCCYEMAHYCYYFDELTTGNQGRT